MSNETIQSNIIGAKVNVNELTLLMSRCPAVICLHETIYTKANLSGHKDSGNCNVDNTIQKKIRICSIYIPPIRDIIQSEIDDLIKQLPKAFILLGDFIFQNEIWESKETNKKDQIIENLMNKSNLCLYKRKTNAYLHPVEGSYSAIDLADTMRFNQLHGLYVERERRYLWKQNKSHLWLKRTCQNHLLVENI